jgi:VWFA-related protein
MRASRAIAFRVAAMVALAAPPLFARQTQAPPPAGRPELPPIVFKAEANYVEIDVVVSDPGGAPVGALTKDDFTVTEDGKPQTVSVFSHVEIPIEVRERTPVTSEPDVQTNARPFEGRVFVIVFDDLHISPERTPHAMKVAREFITRHLGANDLAAVIQTSGNKKGAQDFTGNQRLLLNAVSAFSGRKLRSATLEKIDFYNATKDLPAPPPIQDTSNAERIGRAVSTLATLKSLSQRLAGLHGRRKAVLLISEGLDYDITVMLSDEVNRDPTAVRDAMHAMVGAATQANVSIYSIDPRGLTAGIDGFTELANLPGDTAIPGRGRDPVGLDTAGFQRETRVDQDSLRTLADDTGGFAAVNLNDLQPSFARLVKETSSYYILGYDPGDHKPDGRFHKVTVKVKRPGLEVRARPGYFSPKADSRPSKVAVKKDDASPELHAALDNPLPQAGLEIHAWAGSFQGDKGKASLAITVEFPGRNMKFTEKNGLYVDDLETSLVALDQAGQSMGGTHGLIPIALQPAAMAAARRNRLRMQSRLELPPGRYRLRVAARETAPGGAMGSLHYDVEVPDFNSGDLALSGLAMTSAYASRSPTAAPDPVFRQILPAPPTALRDFPANDTLAVFAEIYDSGTASHDVDIRTTIRNDEGSTVFASEETRPTEAPKKGRSRLGYTARIPLPHPPAGEYTLRVEARSRLDQRAAAAREVRFRVWTGQP